MNVSSVLKVNDSIELKCEVSYSGRWTPDFECFEDAHSPRSNTSVPLSE